MGANQSAGRPTTGHSISDDNKTTDGAANHAAPAIQVVNPTPSATHQECHIVLPKRLEPILTLEGSQIDPNRHRPGIDQLDPKFWIEFIACVSEFADSRADLVARRQTHLQEKIMQIDYHVQKFTDSYMSEQHRALARLNDDCKKMDEIEKMVQKSTIQSELCLSMLNKMNFILPEGSRLEPLEP